VADNLIPEHSMPVKNAKSVVKSEFCPLLSNGDGICAVSGSEDGQVLIYDILRDSPLCINRLQGENNIKKELKMIRTYWNCV
jgi:hypothetical protein